MVACSWLSSRMLLQDDDVISTELRCSVGKALKTNFKHLELPKLELIITVRILRFIEKVGVCWEVDSVSQSTRGVDEMSTEH
jgi:hypothetical protein